MDINKQIFEEFLKNKEIEKQNEETNASEDNIKEQEKIDENIEEKVNLSQNTKDSTDDKEQEELTENLENNNDKLAGDLIYSNPKFIEFKEKFSSEEKNNNLLLFFLQIRNQGINIFDDDFFIYNKMIYKNIKIVMLDPSKDDIAMGKTTKFFLVRPITPAEYQSFIAQYKSKDSHPDEFMEFVVTKGVIYPERYNADSSFQFEYTTGEALSLYDTIINISDLNKRYRVIEV